MSPWKRQKLRSISSPSSWIASPAILESTLYATRPLDGLPYMQNNEHLCSPLYVFADLTLDHPTWILRRGGQCISLSTSISSASRPCARRWRGGGSTCCSSSVRRRSAGRRAS